jgi:hypothetical protein
MSPRSGTHQSLRIPVCGVVLAADVGIPETARGAVLFAHGSGSGRHSPRNRYVADELNRAALVTVLADDEQDEDNKGRYKFPYGDFEEVHRCRLLAAESRAGQRKYYDIELAVAHLHGMLDVLRRRA